MTGVEPQISTSRGPNNQVTGVEPQISTVRRPNKQVTGREVQGSDSEEFMVQPPCCLAHSYKTNIVFTERLLLRNSSKDHDESDKNLRKKVKVLEFMNWWRAVFELSALTTAFHVSMGPGFHNNSTRSLKSPQTSLGHAVQQQTGFHNNSTRNLKSPQTSLGHAVQQQTGFHNNSTRNLSLHRLPWDMQSNNKLVPQQLQKEGKKDMQSNNKL